MRPTLETVMHAKDLLEALLNAESEAEVIAALTEKGLLNDPGRWRYLGNMPNNQSIVHAQQSTPTAALVEKFTNGVDAILLKRCKAMGIDPRAPNAPQSMSDAIESFFGDLTDVTKIRGLAEENLVLYATGSKARPCLSIYDAGEGQLPEDFPKTFCSLIHASADGSYKGAIPFVQGRFNMGGTGVLPFCSDQYKLQLIVSRVPDEIGKNTNEWAFTLFCFFPSKQNPSWKYLVGADGEILTAGPQSLGLLPKLGAKSGEVCLPRQRQVSSGTLIKMYDFKAPRSNICGELFKKLQDYLLCPSLPLRIIECREAYKANVMGVNVWDRFGIWARSKKLEEGFEDGASVTIKLESGETIPAEIRVFKATKDNDSDAEAPQTGLRALINGQSHAKRDAQFFRTKAVDKEHIAGSMLVTLDCSELGQDTKNSLFMSNRETFREDTILNELFRKLQKELHDHEGLIHLDLKRYEEKIKNAVSDEQGISALEELLATDPTLAELFGSTTTGKVAAKTSTDGEGGKIDGTPQPFVGLEFPTFIHRPNKLSAVSIKIPQGEVRRVSFLTDVKNNYFTRKRHRGFCTYTGSFEPTFHLFNGRLTFTCAPEKHTPLGTILQSEITITDNKGSGPFKLNLQAEIVPVPEETTTDKEKNPQPPKQPKVHAGPSRPDISEIEKGPDDPPLEIEKVPNSDRLKLVLNTGSQLLKDAKNSRPKHEEAAVAFVFKYGLALTAMGLLDRLKKLPEWQNDESACREKVIEAATGIARVIVPLCLSLPKQLPKPKG